MHAMHPRVGMEISLLNSQLPIFTKPSNDLSSLHGNVINI